jgi:hypothetical protein
VHERLAHGGLTHSWAESILAKRTATICVSKRGDAAYGGAGHSLGKISKALQCLMLHLPRGGAEHSVEQLGRRRGHAVAVLHQLRQSSVHLR